jgi:hypothetical protein
MERFSKPAYLCLSMEMDLKFIQRGTRPAQTFKSDWRPVRALQTPQMGAMFPILLVHRSKLATASYLPESTYEVSRERRLSRRI